jgi:hypothetical protein
MDKKLKEFENKMLDLILSSENEIPVNQVIFCVISLGVNLALSSSKDILSSYKLINLSIEQGIKVYEEIYKRHKLDEIYKKDKLND